MQVPSRGGVDRSMLMTSMEPMSDAMSLSTPTNVQNASDWIAKHVRVEHSRLISVRYHRFVGIYFEDNERGCLFEWNGS